MDILSKMIAQRWYGASRDYCPQYLSVVAGIRHIPRSGPFILVANHTSAADALLLLSVCYAVRDDRPAVLAKISGFAGRHKHFYRAIGGISPEERWKGNEERPAVEQVLDEGRPLVVFPEGTRGPGGRLLPFQDKAFSLAARLDVPIVPAALVGTSTILPKGKIVPARHTTHRAMLAFGEPLTPDPRAPRNARKTTLLVRSRNAIEQLLAQLTAGQLDVTQDGRELAELAASLTGRLTEPRAMRRKAWERIYPLLSLARVDDPAMLDQETTDAASRLMQPLIRRSGRPRLAVWSRYRDLRALQRVSPDNPGHAVVSSVLRLHGRVPDNALPGPANAPVSIT